MTDSAATPYMVADPSRSDDHVASVPARRSAPVRLALTIAAIAVIVTGALFALTYLIAARHSDAALARSINTDMTGLIDIYSSGGVDELRARMADRLVFEPIGAPQTLYLLAESDGAALAGNVAAWPKALDAASSAAKTFRAGKGAEPVRIRATQLDAGLKLLVGKSLSPKETLLKNISLAFGMSGLIIVVGAALLGDYYMRRANRRLSAMNAALRAVSEGDFSARAPALDGADELWEMQGHLNQFLTHLNDVVDAHARVSDVTAHEIRTPLMHLDARLLTILKTVEDPALANDLGAARASIKRIVALLDSLLDIAANQVRKGSQVGLQPLDLSGITAQVADLYAPSAEELGVTFTVKIAHNVRILGERMQLMRLLSNLLDNAFKYAGTKGQVWLVLEAGPTLSVADNGPGVPEDLREQIFQRFQRGPGTQPITLPQRDVGGHGLGLALARAIAERHGLTLTCEAPETGQGARFVVRKDGVRASG